MDPALPNPGFLLQRMVDAVEQVRQRLLKACAALKGAGIDHADASPRQAVHVVFADEVIREGEPAPSPGVEESLDLGAFCVIELEALVRIKLTAFRDKDRTYLRDLIEVGLVDETWPARLPGVLGERLQLLLDTPEG